MDNHNTFGQYVTPRTLLKYNFTQNTTGRISIGTGWRTVNLFSENIMLLASSRDVIITEQLKPEQALNYGTNLTHKIYGNKINTQTLSIYTVPNLQIRYFRILIQIQLKHLSVISPAQV